MLSTFKRLRAVSFSVLGACTLAAPAHANVLFKGDLETGDLKQWSYLLKEEGLSVVTDPVAEGKYAGKVTITKNELWTNGLNRVEVQHKPDDAYLTDGKEIYYGFSFYLPEKLTADNHQILYWETTETYQQVMQLAVEGELMRFATQKPAWKVHWEADGKATAGKWHRVVVHVKWSASADSGLVDLWFDSEQVVTAGKAQTFLGTPAFVQHGILRDTIDKVETLYFDEARSGTSLEDVLMSAATSGGSSGGQTIGGQAAGGQAVGGQAAGGEPSGGQAPSVTNGGTSSTSLGGQAISAGMATGGTSSSELGTTAGATSQSAPPRASSSCAFAPRPSSGAAALAAILGLIALRRHRRARARFAAFWSTRTEVSASVSLSR